MAGPEDGAQMLPWLWLSAGVGLAALVAASCAATRGGGTAKDPALAAAAAAAATGGGGALASLSRGNTRYFVEGPADGGGLPLVVLVHGFVGSAAYLRFLSKELARRGRRVLRYDLYGRGGTACDGSPHTAEALATQLAELLQRVRALEQQRPPRAVDLVGYSMGGGIASAFAAIYPSRLRSLTLIAPVGTAEMPMPAGLPLLLRLPLLPRLVARVLVRPSFLADKGEWEEPDAQGSNWPAFASEEARRSADEGASLGKAALNSLQHFPWRGCEVYHEKIGRRHDDQQICQAAGRLPVLLMWGELDAAVPFAGAAAIRRSIPHAELWSVAAAGHILPIERSADVAAKLLAWWPK